MSSAMRSRGCSFPAEASLAAAASGTRSVAARAARIASSVIATTLRRGTARSIDVDVNVTVAVHWPC